MSIWTTTKGASQNREETAGNMELELVSLPPAWYRNFSVFIHRMTRVPDLDETTVKRYFVRIRL